MSGETRGRTHQEVMIPMVAGTRTCMRAPAPRAEVPVNSCAPWSCVAMHVHTQERATANRNYCCHDVATVAASMHACMHAF